MTNQEQVKTLDLTDGSRSFRMQTRLREEIVERLVAAVRKPDLERNVLVLSHPPVDTNGRNLYLQARLNFPDYAALVGRFPVPRTVPANWLPALEYVDQIWVPSRTGRDRLNKAGVDQDKIVIVPPIVSIREGEKILPYPLDKVKPFSLLAFVDQENRTGWQEVITAWLGAFAPEDPVSLVLAPRPGRGAIPLCDRVAKCVQDQGRDLGVIPEILLVEEAVNLKNLLSLCLKVDGLILPQDEDERGLVALYSMAAGIAPMGNAAGVLRTLLHSSRSFPLADSDSLELSIRRLYEVPRERVRRGRNATNYITTTHAPPLVSKVVMRQLTKLGASQMQTIPLAGEVLSCPPGQGPEISLTAIAEAAEVNVSSRVDYRHLLRRGVDPGKLLYLPTPVPDRWLQESPPPCPEIMGDGKFRFLCAPENLATSGWELLVGVFAEVFQGNPAVVLHLVLPQATDCALVNARLPALLARSGGAGQVAPIRVHGPMPNLAPGALFTAVNCGVLPTSEPTPTEFARQAMAFGTPLIIPGWSGHLDLCGELGTARLLGMRPSENQGWAPDPVDLGRALTEAVGNKGAFMGMGDRSREELARNCSHWSRARDQRAHRVRAGAPPVADVVFEGPVFKGGSQAIILRELVRALAAEGDCRPAIRHTGVAEWAPEATGCDADLSRLLVHREVAGAKIVVRGGWPPVFRHPQAGYFILRVDWEWGRIPLSWLAPLVNVDEIWVHSEHVLRSFTDSGIHESRVRVMHHGVDPELFTPEGDTLAELRAEIGERHAFLFVGGAIFRKGLDILLSAYARAFTASDPVCLVVKEVGRNDFYKDQGLGGLVDRFITTPGAPKVIRAPDKLSLPDIAALYRTCDTLVHSYRGEGFGLPVLEGMASGLPVIVTAGGSTQDFARGDSVLTIPASRREVEFGEPCVGSPWILEPDQDALVALMGRAIREAVPLRQAAATTADYLRREWTWKKSAARAAVRLRGLGVGTGGLLPQ